MASKAGAYALVVGGAVIAYSAFTKRSVFDTLTMRHSPGSITSDGTTSGSSNGENVSTEIDPDTYTGGVRQAVLEYALQAINEPTGTYEYDKIRPYPSSLFTGSIPRKTDCSGYVTLCYKAAGAADPNGLGYSGQGYTGTLLAHGTSIDQSDAEGADLVFWAGPDHVAIYAGGGIVYEFGSNPGPISTTLTEENGYHSQFLGFRRYLAA